MSRTDEFVAAWVVREKSAATPMQSFETSLTDAEETQKRWANDGYESVIVELWERPDDAALEELPPSNERPKGESNVITMWVAARAAHPHEYGDNETFLLALEDFARAAIAQEREGRVALPTTVDEAVAMLRVSVYWLNQHAPEVFRAVMRGPALDAALKGDSQGGELCS